MDLSPSCSLAGEHDIPEEYIRRHPDGDGVSVTYFKRVLWITEVNSRVAELRSKGYDIQSSSERDRHGFVYLRPVSVPAAKQMALLKQMAHPKNFERRKH